MGVWRLEELGEGNPIERFTDDEAGYLLVSDMWHALTREDQFEAFRGGYRDLGSSGFYGVLQIVSSIGCSLTVGATAIHVVLWLEGRRER
jgi:hypothetical protein